MGYITPRLKYVILFIIIGLLVACSKKNHSSYQSEIEGLIYNTSYCYQSQIQTTQQQFQRTLKLAEQNNSNAEYLIGLAYYYGINTSADKNLGMQYLLKAAKQNNDKAMFVYGNLLLKDPSKKNHKQSVYWFKKASNLGNIYATTNINLLQTSKSEKDYNQYQKRIYLYAKNDGYTQFFLGFQMIQPDGNKNMQKGIKLLTQSFHNLNSPIYIKSKAATQLSLIYYDQNNEAQATYWRKKAQDILKQYGCTKQTSSEVL